MTHPPRKIFIKPQHTKKSLITTSILAFASVHAQTNTDWKTCYYGKSSRYNGTVSETVNGKTCQNWGEPIHDDQPHKHLPSDASDLTHNYCRNPEGDLSGTWCYTTDPEVRWEYCKVTKCDSDNDESTIYWTMIDTNQAITRMVTMEADPEKVKQIVNQLDEQSKKVGMHVVHAEPNSEFWAIAADHKNQRLIWSDYRSEYVGTFDPKTGAIEKFFHGMAHGIENIAVDWQTGNIYWTDSAYKWICVADENLSFFKPIIRTEATVSGIAVDPISGYLFYSEYPDAAKGSIRRCDLAGNDCTSILSFPTVNDALSLTVTYSDRARLFWTDYVGEGGIVMSSDLDGKNLVKHFHRIGSTFWSVAHYDGWLYITDITEDMKRTESGNIETKYKIWIVHADDPDANDKNDIKKQNVHSYSIASKPRAIALYSPSEQEKLLNTKFVQTRNLDNPCDTKRNGIVCVNICIPVPDKNDEFKSVADCHCQLGLEVNDNGECASPSIDQANYMLVADGTYAKCSTNI